jgi:hypothetical protein
MLHQALGYEVKGGAKILIISTVSCLYPAELKETIAIAIHATQTRVGLRQLIPLYLSFNHCLIAQFVDLFNYIVNHIANGKFLPLLLICKEWRQVVSNSRWQKQCKNTQF